MPFKFNPFTGTLDMVADPALVGMNTDFSNAVTSTVGLVLGANGITDIGSLVVVDPAGNSGTLDKLNISTTSVATSASFPNAKFSTPDATSEIVDRTSAIFFKAGNATGTSALAVSTGPIYLIGGDINDTATSPATGPVFIRSGKNNNAANTATTGDFTSQSGDNNGLGDTGRGQVKSGNSANGISGEAGVFSGSGATGSGPVTMESGNGGSGPSGNIELITGPTTGAPGEFRFIKASDGINIGDYWISTSNDGLGYWAALVMAWNQLVNTNLVPDGNGTRQLGSDGSNWQSVKTNAVISNDDLLLECAGSFVFEGGDTVDMTAIATVDLTGSQVDGLVVKSDILPNGNGTINIGGGGVAFATITTKTVNVGNQGWRVRSGGNADGSNLIIANGTGLVSPGGVATGAQITVDNFTSAFGLYSENNATADANPTAGLTFETGNKTAGTGPSGNINFQTGTSIGGLRGTIKLNALMATLPIGTSDPTGVDNGDSYYNTSTNQLRIYNGGTWRGIALT